MKVSTINQNNLNNTLTTFESNNLHIKLGNRILNKIPDVNPQEYDKMSFLSKYILREITPERLQELAKITCDIAYHLKTRYDRIFGEDNYMIIAIGRSMASIAETLNFMGGDAKILPMSELRHYIPKPIRDIEVYRKYLDKIGLTKEEIRKNPQKQFILMDYAVSGDSLMCAKEFLEQPELLDKSDNLISRTLNPVIKSLNVLKLFYHERLKNFSPVGKLPLDKLKDVDMQADSKTSQEGRGNVCQYIRKLFLFNLLDNLSKNNFHGFVPQKEINAIARYESQEFLERQYLKALHQMRKKINSIKFDK